MTAARLPASDLDSPRRPSTGLWAAATLGAALLHAAAVAAVIAHRSAEEVDDVGVPAIEISLDLASPRVEPSELPPGPEAEASAAATASIEQAKPIEQAELAKEAPTTTEEADRVVAPEVVETVKEEPTKTPMVAPTEVAPSQESVAAEATAPLEIETAREAPTHTAPVTGVGRADAKVRAAWQKRLVVHLDRNKRYPPGNARKASVIVTFTIDRLGRVVAASVFKSSGDPDFDAAALAMMRRADPVPAPPPLIADEGLTFTVPVVFRGRDRG